METLGSSTKSEHQFSKQDAGPFKRKPVPVANGPLFTIPRLKKIKRELLTDLPLDTHECQHDVLSQIRKSFHFSFSNLCHTFSRVQSVNNPKLTTKYLEKKRDMKSSGYSDALVTDTYAFLPVDSPAAVDKMCTDGIRCGNQQFSGLGVSHMAVHVCKHADILTPMKPKFGDKILLMVKVLKGKIKTVVCKNVGVQLEPTPNYDCHIAKPNVDQSVPQPPHMLFYSSQFYLYEYGDFKVEDYPRQVLPYAVVYYTIREPQVPVPKATVSVNQTQVIQAPSQKGLSSLPASSPTASSSSLSSSSTAPESGPSNEVWRGRLHVHLVEGGHIFIEVVMLSYFVPLTVTIISPIKIHGLYPEHNALFTFFCGLTNIAERDEVEWRAHYFRSCIMRPRVNNEEHFKALIKHISMKREMPTVRLPHDVFLFLMPDCLLASQLGLVRRDDDSPVLHCVIMSKYSTSQAQRKHLMERNMVFKNYGSAASWEDLFDDSDFSDSDEPSDTDSTRLNIRKRASALFREQRYIHNKFASMSLADAEVNFAPCACKKLSPSQTHQQRCRTDDIARVYNAMQPNTQPSHAPSQPCFPPGSRHKPKQKMSRKAMNMPSFSPHGSSDSDMESDSSSNSRAPGSSSHDQFSLLNSTKTVEEELSEEELTNEQMEDIIFLRKPVLSSSSLSKPKPLSHSKSTTDKAKYSAQSSDTAVSSLRSSHSADDIRRYNKSLSSAPRIIPTEPLKPAIEKTTHSTKSNPDKCKQIPTEPVESSTGHADSNSPPETSEPAPAKPNDFSKKPQPKVPKSILKSSIVPTVPAEAAPKENKEPVPPPISSSPFSFTREEENDFGDVDMRVPHQHSASLHPVFLLAGEASFQHQLSPPHHQNPKAPQLQLSPNLSFGSWLAPGDFKPPKLTPSLLQHPPAPPLSPPLPPPPPLPPTAQSPASPVLESPASPPLCIDSESPASPPMSMFTDQLRSSPIAIPTSRVQQNASPPEPSINYIDHYPPGVSRRGSGREGINSADDMKNFLNSGFDSDFDSEEDEH